MKNPSTKNLIPVDSLRQFYADMGATTKFDMKKGLTVITLGDANNPLRTETIPCILENGIFDCFFDKSEVYFKHLSDSEIDFYIKQYKPFDKAGAYGIQEWIGMIGVQNINGSYYNVMGLPVFELWEELQKIKNAQK